MEVTDATFVVVDTETTGTNAKHDRIIELAAVKMTGGKVVDRIQQLVNPGRAIPRRITGITGITTAMVYDQPAIDEVLPGFLEFLADGIFVAQNCSFDLRFVNAELRRLGEPVLSNKTLCTLRLARRLLPGLPSKGLSSLVNFYGINVRGRHRALGDAQATALILKRFLQRLDFEYEIDTVPDLLTFQYRKYSGRPSEAVHLQRLRREVLPELPDAPGVYFFRDKQDQLLYVGKAKNLQNRVRSYFNGVEGHPERTRMLVRNVRDVTWKQTGSELEALLLESRLIKELQPRFNRALRRYRRRPFLRLDGTHEAPTVALTTTIRDDGAEYYGPLGGRRQGELILDAINKLFRLRECTDDVYERGKRCLYADIERCAVPCEEEGAYHDEVARVRAFLTGNDESALHKLEERMHTASRNLKFEDAAVYRDMIRSLKRILKRQQMIASPVLRHNAVFVQPGFQEGTVHYYLVRFGRLCETVTLPVVLSENDMLRLRDALKRCFDTDLDRPKRYFKPEVEEVRLLSQWMAQHDEELEAVACPPGAEMDEIMERVRDAADHFRF